MAEQDFEIENGVVVDYQGTDTDIIIPNGVREIGDGVFWGSDIERVKLPPSVKAIRSEAFMNCHELRTVELPDSITKIEEEAIFIGDSPNDEPMFRRFALSAAVSNITKFADKLEFLPKYIAKSEGGFGFAEISERIIQCIGQNK